MLLFSFWSTIITNCTFLSFSALIKYTYIFPINCILILMRNFI
nr:MAG TPA: hypothetical protein [Caudoviricetes sp.]